MTRWISAVLFVGAAPILCSPIHAADAALEPLRWPSSPNIVLILADDLGVDLLAAFGARHNVPCTPAIDQLAEQGMVFRNAWATPWCSPTRAQIMTGLHPRRSGIGELIRRRTPDRLSAGHVGLPRLMGPLYESSAIGKWHLATLDSGRHHPWEFGFDYFSGSMENLNSGINLPATLTRPASTNRGHYELWLRIFRTGLWVERTHATAWTVAEAIARAEKMSPPWFLYVPFHAIHVPAHFPQRKHCHKPPCPGGYCELEWANDSPTRLRAMLESFDFQLSIMLEGIANIDPDAVIIFAGDNGSAEPGALSPQISGRLKSTVYQGGVHVPLIIKGPELQRGSTDALVTLADLFPTIIELAGIEPPPSDGRSLVPLLTCRNAPPPHRTIYTESFKPNYDPFAESFQPTRHARAVRDSRYKLIRITDLEITFEELYDLALDPFEQQNLLPPANLADYLAYLQLSIDMARYEAPLGAD